MNSLNIKKDQYISKIIRDIESPMIAQIVALESFLHTASSKISPDEKDLIELTLNSCKYLYKTVEVFNSVYKLNFEPLVLNYEEFNIVELIHELIDEIRILVKYNELQLEFNSEKEIIIGADKAQIKKVIESLLSNSVNYAFKNSKIEVRLLRFNDKIVFEIKNNSPYIEEEVLREIFSKYKMCALYNKNGIGLGLFLSKEIINAHNGTMIAKSYPEDVSVFGFEIPLKG
ncbi:MAG: HAMP domain-containing histidine kinase [Candidatus Gastranaerophilales bacterium]|nr:HAMP domain-containing histidine kinase [Candidatus Gastranaerophilales bacterium]